MRPSFNVYVDVDNRERATARDKKKENFFWKSNMKIFYFLFYFILFLFFMRNVSGQQGAASKVKMNASGKKKKNRRGTQALKTKYLVSTRIQNV